MSTTGVEITAGLGGFLVLFGLALAVWFLGRDLTRRLRGMRQREALRLRAQEPPGQGRGTGDSRPGQDPGTGPR